MQFEVNIDRYDRVRVTIDEATGNFKIERFDEYDEDGDRVYAGSWEVTDDSTKNLGLGWFGGGSAEKLLVLIFKKLTDH